MSVIILFCIIIWVAITSVEDKLRDRKAKEEYAALKARNENFAKLYKSNFNSEQKLMRNILHSGYGSSFYKESFELLKPNLSRVFGKKTKNETIQHFINRTGFNLSTGSPTTTNSPAYWMFNLLLSLDGKISSDAWSNGWRPGDYGDYNLNMSFLKEIQENLSANGCPLKLVAKRKTSKTAESDSFRGDVIVPSCQVFPGHYGVSPWS